MLDKAIHLARRVPPADARDILGVWIETTQGAKYVLEVSSALKPGG